MKRVDHFFLATLVAGSSAGIGCLDYLHDPEIFQQGRGIDGVPGSGGTGGGGGTTTLNPSCIPSNSDEVVDDSCGLFVSSSQGDDSNDGTKAAPFATIEKAVGAGKGQPVYVCGESFTEALELSAGALLYGALDCTSGWAYVPSKRTTIAPGADVIPLRVSSKASVELYDVNLSAADATLPGGSSIGVLAQAETELMLTRSDVTAGNGAPGVEGAAFDMPAMSGGDGLPGADACTGPVTIGGLSVKNTCGDGDSVSGIGGAGTEASGGTGSPGSPLGSMNGGQGEIVDVCTDGIAGGPGEAGLPGAGASGLGALTSEGFAGITGGEGQPGKVAQGGGGGGGAKGGAGNGTGMQKKECGTVSMAPGNAGASGASGGAGGCGGAGGKGGGAAGSSIGIASLGAKLTFEGVTITTKAGGKGGNGGTGQAGGPGGLGGIAGEVPTSATDLKPGCGGGDGGPGGAGGKGGGGLGGHSIGLAHTGAAPTTDGAQINVGTAGNPGAGEGVMGNGQPGVTMTVQKF